ncbi:MAG: ABC transporter permease [Deinococcales bacterium]
MLLILLFGVELNLCAKHLGQDKALAEFDLAHLSSRFGTDAIMTRMTRTAVLEVLRQDYVRTAKSKGLSERRVTLAHILRNALITIITIIILSFSELIIGTIVIEQVFALPGMGTLVITSIFFRDYPLLQGAILLYATVIVLLSFIVDSLYSFLDPRIRYV